ncbi:1,3-beta-glucanosyltransferase gas1 [Sticta canariensis]|nr:1,3-beta-glucanosyltransferase gas1 [Sticta canariensis]
MALFAQAGIYVMVDFMAPQYRISSGNPTWNKVLYNHYTSVIDIMQTYNSLLGFILGDDVIDGISQNDSGPYVKAAIRDMKAYIRHKRYRPIPVGYVSEYEDDALVYLNCGDKNDDTIDFWGMNSRDGLCGDVNHKVVTTTLSTYSVPVFLAAYGCADSTQWNYSNIDVLYGQSLSQVWSGGVIYQYFIVSRDDPRFGLVGIQATGVITVTNYQNISRHLATVLPSSINSEKYIPTNTAAACPVGAASSLPPNPIAVSLTASSPRTSADTVSATAATASSPRKSASSITPTPKASNDALSPGGKVGIGIGSALLVLSLVLGTFFIRKRAMERKRIDRGPWTKTELAADDVDREARGYGPHMAASIQRAEVEGSGVMREVQADSSERFEAPGDLPVLPELSGTSRRGDSLM